MDGQRRDAVELGDAADDAAAMGNFPQDQIPLEAEQFRIGMNGMVPNVFRFCDDTASGNPLNIPAEPGHTLQTLHVVNVTGCAVRASSEDHEDQSASVSLLDNGNFWSSTGSEATSGEECILFKLAAPLCVVRAVQLAAYRAHFQVGSPVYPSVGISIEIGHSPGTMRPVMAEPLPCVCHDGMQTFLLPSGAASSAVGSFVGVRFLGKRQQQLDDLLYYVAIRHVRVMGEALPHYLEAPYRCAGLNHATPCGHLTPLSLPSHLSASLSPYLGSVASVGRPQVRTRPHKAQAHAERDPKHVEQVSETSGARQHEPGLSQASAPDHAPPRMLLWLRREEIRGGVRDEVPGVDLGSGTTAAGRAEAAGVGRTHEAAPAAQTFQMGRTPSPDAHAATNQRFGQPESASPWAVSGEGSVAFGGGVEASRSDTGVGASIPLRTPSDWQMGLIGDRSSGLLPILGPLSDQQAASSACGPVRHARHINAYECRRNCAAVVHVSFDQTQKLQPLKTHERPCRYLSGLDPLCGDARGVDKVEGYQGLGTHGPGCPAFGVDILQKLFAKPKRRAVEVLV